MPRGKKHHVNPNKGTAAFQELVCYNGSNCQRKDCIYQHNGPPILKQKSNDEPCMAFLGNNCSFSAATCRKRHPPQDEVNPLRAKYASIPCRFQWQCKTKSCLYIHPDGFLRGDNNRHNNNNNNNRHNNNNNNNNNNNMPGNQDIIQQPLEDADNAFPPLFVPSPLVSAGPLAAAAAESPPPASLMMMMMCREVTAVTSTTTKDEIILKEASFNAIEETTTTEITLTVKANEIKDDMKTGFFKEIKDELNIIKNTMATKDDIQRLQRQMATKDDIQKLQRQMATKDDIQRLQRQLQEMNQNIMDQMQEMHQTMMDQMQEMHRRTTNDIQKLKETKKNI